MDSNIVIASITALAAALAENLSDEELILLGAAFTQLGDTLETISVVNDLYGKKRQCGGRAQTQTAAEK